MLGRLLEQVAGVKRLNWGCGAHVAPGWINSDVKDEPGVDLVADIRQGLPLESEQHRLRGQHPRPPRVRLSGAGAGAGRAAPGAEARRHPAAGAAGPAPRHRRLPGRRTRATSRSADRRGQQPRRPLRRADALVRVLAFALHHRLRRRAAGEGRLRRRRASAPSGSPPAASRRSSSSTTARTRASSSRARAPRESAALPKTAKGLDRRGQRATIPRWHGGKASG